jgi:hypothetical protein
MFETLDTLNDASWPSQKPVDDGPEKLNPWPITKNQVETMEAQQNRRFYGKIGSFVFWPRYIAEKRDFFGMGSP